MAKRYSEITPKLQTFISQQHLFFVGTAAADGRVNVSPKGMDTLRVLSPQQVVWLNLTGSGNETAAHLLENPRMTLMFCALAGEPLILRLYGQAKTFHPRDPEWAKLSALFEPLPGARQVIDIQIDLVQTSCGMAVPYYAFQGEREQLRDWAINKGKAGLNTYWQQKNQVSIDGKPTQIFTE
ncbi:MAG: pyridoxamine 5'-phosphate oxidase family protein [Spirulina sp. SIO3F2]|nr:pyridoxamine 5'-phosphate oxidase family protein [Spirulina sp. SIO3F2]